MADEPMANPYSSPARVTTQRIPIVRPISWLATIPQLVALTAAVAIGWWVTQSAIGIFWGAVAYLIYSFSSRMLIPRAHRRGIRLSRNQRYEDAIRAHQESYDFFTRHLWLDRFRSITMMSSSAMSYREMALINIAFAYSQIGNGAKAKEYYLRALQEFPDSAMASAALRMIESFEQSYRDPQKATQAD
jgi:tetratricopeptide (TPR) repeat protein